MGMPKEVLAQLKKVRVRNRPLNISLDTGNVYPQTDKDFPSRPKRSLSNDRPSTDCQGECKKERRPKREGDATSRPRDSEAPKKSYRIKKSD